MDRVSVQVVPNVSQSFETPPIAFGGNGLADLLSQNSLESSNEPGAMPMSAAPSETPLPPLDTAHFPLPAAFQPSIEQDHPMANAGSLPAALPLQLSKDPNAASAGLFYTANVPNSVLATVNPVVPSVVSSANLAQFVPQATAPFVQPPYDWLFRPTSMFEMASDDYLTMQFGAYPASSPLPITSASYVNAQTMVFAVSPRVDIWFLRTLLIIEHVCTYSMSRRKHEMAEIIHSVVVTLASRNNLMTAAHQSTGDDRQSLEKRWKEWAQRESVIRSIITPHSAKRSYLGLTRSPQFSRLAHAIFISDVQYMVFLSHQPRLSVNQLKLPLPSPRALWEARSAWEWQMKLREIRKSGQTHSWCSIQSGVEALLARKEILQPFKKCRHQLSLLIHGIASTIMDLNQRQVVTFRTTGTRMLQVADVEECLKLWHDCFTSIPHHKAYESDTWSAKTIYHLSTILLQTSLDEIQRAAGNAFASGQPVSTQNARSSYNHLTTTNPVSHESYIHALEVVTLSLQEPSSDSDAAPPAPLWSDYGA
ncbi:hypothetical protein KEM56_007192, partial [Ascosphaera pollenicola]